MVLSPNLIFRIPALLIAITFHEFAHARVAYHFGDPTAKAQGRLSLNPLAHLDPLGLLMLWLVGFGWAKPVPINPFNFRDRRQGMLWVSLAGVLANLIIAFISMFLFYIAGSLMARELLEQVVLYNVFLAVFNIIPLPPLDGSKVLSTLLPYRYQHPYYQIEQYGPFILILLLVFGLLQHVLLPISMVIIETMRIIVALLIF